jgi:hypothetical protein
MHTSAHLDTAACTIWSCRCSFAGVAKDWLLIMLSVLLFKAPITIISVIGYLIAFGGAKYYSRPRREEASTAQTPAAQSPIDDDDVLLQVESISDGAPDTGRAIDVLQSVASSMSEVKA